MKIEATTRDAYDLLHEGAIVLNQIMADGMRIDVGYLEHQKRVLTRRCQKIEARFWRTELGRAVKRRYGTRANIGSDKQLAQILFKEMGCESKETEKGNESVTREALEALDVPGISELIRWRKSDKTLGTYVLGILKEQTDGVLRPFFNLGTVRTFRSSSDSFNFQVMPIRDEMQGKTVRQALYPWENQRLLETDYGGLEVRIACCYHQDPTMIEYLIGQGDMHRDGACDVFCLDKDQVTKDVRFHTKNSWIFAQFYGSWYKPCAESLWSRIDQFGLNARDGTPLKQHLRKAGIRDYNDFETHCREMERKLWDDRFPAYRDWKAEQTDRYERDGYVDMLTGFRCVGPLSRNDTINYPIQGAAFHCLLWSLIQIVKTANEEKWGSKLMGQVHDSIVSSLVPEESDHVLDTVLRISQDEIRDAWDWIIVPLKVEAEAGPVDGSWYEKTEIKEIEKADTVCGHRFFRELEDVGWECLTCGGNELIPF